ncbi:alpha/beta hydrolase [Priestia taiwanensis]|uniref:Alpha/beta hydrolase n=1 Tax=Priestia taiwanensis TaxID=1347902 RepID=A0A917ATW7_9BACI|nr:alpha/beta hydrolase [Priestia taiwanensis]MBM7363661.1 dipeptidyl aminopeptidase/acylaminoacyl peptidase [Priestia taiwanensis]GGE75130.1 alpha/beta hydrolase [Priestia taiwanensis]
MQIHQELQKPIRKRKWIRIIVSICVIGLVGVVGVSYYIGSSLVHPDRKEVNISPADAGIPYESISFKNINDDVQLRGWSMKTKQPSDKWVIVSHGYGGNRAIWKEKTLEFYQFFLNNGINVLTFDYRNSGESDGDTTTIGAMEKHDLLSAIQYIRAEYPSAEIGLYGVSQGAATSLLAGSESDDIAFVIADSSFHELEDYLEENLPHWSGLPSYPFTPIILSIVPKMVGHEMEDVSPVLSMQYIDVPILLLHSKGDTAIPISSSQQMYEQYKDSKQIKFIEYENPKHIKLFEDEPDRYKEDLEAFLEEIEFMQGT